MGLLVTEPRPGFVNRRSNAQPLQPHRTSPCHTERKGGCWRQGEWVTDICDRRTWRGVRAWPPSQFNKLLGDRGISSISYPQKRSSPRTPILVGGRQLGGRTSYMSSEREIAWREGSRRPQRGSPRCSCGSTPRRHDPAQSARLRDAEPATLDPGHL